MNSRSVFYATHFCLSGGRQVGGALTPILVVMEFVGAPGRNSSGFKGQGVACLCGIYLFRMS